MNCRLLFAGLLFVLSTACNMPISTPLPATPTKTPRPASTFTAVPPTATPVQLTLRVADNLVNCRYGPDTVYALMNELEEGQFARVIGRNENSTWWYIRDPRNPNGRCWVSAAVTKVEGESDDLPIAAPPAISVTSISLRTEPERINVACNQFPQTVFFESEITTNGPALMTWRLETSTGYVSAEETLTYVESGSQTVNGYYQIPVAGDYWLKIHVLRPNDMTEQLNFPANCAP